MNPLRSHQTIRHLTITTLSLLFVCKALAGSVTDSSNRESDAAFHVGYRVIDLNYPNDDDASPLTVAVWYPTAQSPQPYNYGGPTNGSVAVDAQPLAAAGPYPLLVFSHGYGGGGLSSVFLTEALAARGWVVACPDHHDSHSAVRISRDKDEGFSRFGLWQHARQLATSGPDDRKQYLYRQQEMQWVLRRMLDRDLFGGVIDPERIAVGGHSFGGYTALGLSGTLSNFRDPRIKALLMFSTGSGGYLYSEAELQSVQIPSLLIDGEEEQEQHRGSHTIAELSAKIFDNLSPPKYWLTIRGGNHFSFNNRFKDNFAARHMSGTEQQFSVIRRYAIPFLETYVAGRDQMESLPGKDDPELTQFRVVEARSAD